MKLVLALAAVAGLLSTSAAHSSPICAGDANGDNRVNILDLSMIAAYWGMGTAPYQYGDVDGDSIVGDGDFLVVSSNWGRTCHVVPFVAAD